jgi:hypothetical protein
VRTRSPLSQPRLRVWGRAEGNIPTKTGAGNQLESSRARIWSKSPGSDTVESGDWGTSLKLRRASAHCVVGARLEPVESVMAAAATIVRRSRDANNNVAEATTERRDYARCRQRPKVLAVRSSTGLTGLGARELTFDVLFRRKGESFDGE